MDKFDPANHVPFLKCTWFLCFFLQLFYCSTFISANNMSGFGQDGEFYQGNYYDQQSSGYDMGGGQAFGQDQ